MQVECVQTVEDQLHPHKEHLDTQFLLNTPITSIITSSHKHRTLI
jgi:hypothetical protein